MARGRGVLGPVKGISLEAFRLAHVWKGLGDYRRTLPSSLFLPWRIRHSRYPLLGPAAVPVASGISPGPTLIVHGGNAGVQERGCTASASLAYGRHARRNPPVVHAGHRQ